MTTPKRTGQGKIEQTKWKTPAWGLSSFLGYRRAASTVSSETGGWVSTLDNVKVKVQCAPIVTERKVLVRELYVSLTELIPKIRGHSLL